MRKGWFNDNWRHSLSAKGISTRYMAKRSNRSKRSSLMRGEQPLVFKESLPFQTGTTGEFRKNIARSDVLESSRGKELQRLESERDSLERSLANVKKGADPEMTAELRGELKQRKEAIALMLSQSSSADIGERAVSASAKRSRIMAAARPGEVTQAQRALSELEGEQKEIAGNVERRAGMAAAGEELLPGKSKSIEFKRKSVPFGETGKREALSLRPGSRTVRDVLKERQKTEESQRAGSEESRMLQKPKRFQRLEFPDADAGEEER